MLISHYTGVFTIFRKKITYMEKDYQYLVKILNFITESKNRFNEG
jgi:hypothetical protein